MRRIMIIFMVICLLLSGSQAFAVLVDNGDGTVTDTTTNLMWSQNDAPFIQNWEQAIYFCEHLGLGGYYNWRIPTLTELQSLVDEDQFDPTINTTFFPSTSSMKYLSSTGYYGYGQVACVDFYDGHVSGFDKLHGGMIELRAVRSLFDLPPKIEGHGQLPREAVALQTVRLYCYASDPDGGSIEEYRWDFDNDGIIDSITSSDVATYIYAVAGNYTVTCIVYDDEGQHAITSFSVDISEAPDAKIDTLYGQSPLNMGYVWNYLSVEHPIKQTNPADCKPFAVGDLSSGNLSLQVGLPAFSSGIDVYLAIGFADALYLINGANGLQPAAGLTALPKWKSNNTAAINESLYGNISTSLLPAGIYNLYVLVVPAGETDFSHYYFWATNFTVNH